jgi:hypothetical protein
LRMSNVSGLPGAIGALVGFVLPRSGKRSADAKQRNGQTPYPARRPCRRKLNAASGHGDNLQNKIIKK